jgi:hypothetical protein
MSKIKLKDWCQKNSISYSTGRRWFKNGLIPNAYQVGKTGTILVETEMEPVMSENNAMSLFLRKTVEFAKNNSTVEDFAAYVIANFSLRFSATSEDRPKIKPDPAVIAEHFEQFRKITKTNKAYRNNEVRVPINDGLTDQDLQEMSDKLDQKSESTTQLQVVDSADFSAPYDSPAHDFALKQTEASLSVSNQNVLSKEAEHFIQDSKRELDVIYDSSKLYEFAKDAIGELQVTPNSITLEASEQITLKAPKVKTKKTVKKKGTSNVK